ncbi:MAG: DUF1365 domain-containing protein [Hyphomonadaceae bacterium]
MNDNNLPAAWVYENRTVHARFVPFERRFSYRVSQLLIDIDRIGDVARDTKLFGYNAPALFSFYDADHGPRTGAPLRPWAMDLFAQAGIDVEGGAIRLLTFPRVLGRVFNPLSIFFGYDRDGAPRGAIYEVTNTFGETHCYVAPLDGDRPQRHRARKSLHVSPFFDVAGEYAFQITPPSDRFSLVVENFVGGEREHVATLQGKRARLTDRALMRGFLHLPFMGASVLAAIHWQALKLWLQGARYRAKPAPPKARATIADRPSQPNIPSRMTTR